VLEPCESETFFIEAEVLGCGVDIKNTQHAMAMAECTGKFIEGEDSAIVNAMGIPSIEAKKTVWDPDAGDWTEDTVVISKNNNVAFNVTIHNDGKCCDLTNIVVTDVLPGGMFSGLWYKGVGPDTPPPQVTYNPTTGDIELAWLIPGPLKPCESRTFVIYAKAYAYYYTPKLLTNNLEAHAWSECTQTTVIDDGEAEVLVVDSARIHVDKEWDDSYIDVGDFVTCEIDVDNYGDWWTLNTVEVVDTLPAGMSYHSSTPTADDVVVNVGGTTTITWNDIGPIAPNNDIEIELVAMMDAGPDDEKLYNHVDVTGTWLRGTVTDSDKDWVRRSIP
jgi:uncharacterized repeat protein (TIGR01451 family)